MKLVIIESPYAGNVETNVAYARECMLDSIDRGEAPYASHLLIPQVLNDRDPAERKTGIEIGLAWGEKAELTAIYHDLGLSNGMKYGEDRANAAGRPIEWRSIRRTCEGPLCEENENGAEILASKKTLLSKKWELLDVSDGPQWFCPDCVMVIDKLGENAPPPDIEIETIGDPNCGVCGGTGLEDVSTGGLYPVTCGCK